MLSPSSAAVFVYTVGYRASFQQPSYMEAATGTPVAKFFTNDVTKKALWVESLTSSSNDVNLESRTYNSPFESGI